MYEFFLRNAARAMRKAKASNFHANLISREGFLRKHFFAIILVRFMNIEILIFICIRLIKVERLLVGVCNIFETKHSIIFDVLITPR